MCGIGGILFSRDNGQTLYHRVSKIAQAQLHRGPDEQQILVKGNHGFCHQRLAIIDRQGGKQPFFDHTGRYLILYNGEVYNYKALRQQLAGRYAFVSNSDTEVVLAAYLIWGEDCLDKFIGMFSFLIWDSLSQTGFAARDPLGVKPFVYYSFNGAFLFASETKAILSCLSTKPKIDHQSIVEYVVAPMLSGVEHSVFQGISYLGAGEKLFVSRDRISKKKYINFNISASGQALEIYVQQLRSALEESVKLSVVSDLPVGVFLSGGLDSSILSSLAMKVKAENFKAFTIAFENHSQLLFDENSIVNSDDFPYAKHLATTLGFPMVSVTASLEGIAKALRTVAGINDRIPAWEQEISQHFLSKAASKEFKSVLVGDAADETNYGYFFLLNKAVNYSPLGLIKHFGGDKRTCLLSERLRKLMHPFQYLDEKYTRLVEDNGYTFAGSNEDRVMAMSCLVYKLWLGRLLHHGDIHTMYFGLEARVPFANQNVLDVVRGIGHHLGFRQQNEKYVLKLAAKGLIPEPIIQRKKSALPRDPRLGKVYQEILKQLVSKEQGFVDAYLDKKALLSLCEISKIEENDRMILFNMVSLLYWAKQYA
ncbi:asparagine synthase (glutamine-hydrolyzing) [Cytophagaceae bacterium ABcell3]|nr:asparagine synthase (glutamine-hydrolyzing) [Cytophagaceae bacterium ABcell3]